MRALQATVCVERGKSRLPNRPRSRLPWTRETHRLSATFKDRERERGRLGRQAIPKSHTLSGSPGPAPAGSSLRAHFSRGREKCGLEKSCPACSARVSIIDESTRRLVKHYLNQFEETLL